MLVHLNPQMLNVKKVPKVFARKEKQRLGFKEQEGLFSSIPSLLIT
jgi:hypothetical protein